MNIAYFYLQSSLDKIQGGHTGLFRDLVSTQLLLKLLDTYLVSFSSISFRKKCALMYLLT